MIKVNSRSEYDYCVYRGYEPLLNWKMFTIDINLRVVIQNELFGSTDFQKANQKYYNWIWKKKAHYCEETGWELDEYSSVHVSHIISRGSDRRIALDPRNCNLLLHAMHKLWEDPLKNYKMNIYSENCIVMNILKNDYNLKL